MPTIAGIERKLQLNKQIAEASIEYMNAREMTSNLVYSYHVYDRLYNCEQRLRQLLMWSDKLREPEPTGWAALKKVITVEPIIG